MVCHIPYIEKNNYLKEELIMAAKTKNTNRGTEIINNEVIRKNLTSLYDNTIPDDVNNTPESSANTESENNQNQNPTVNTNTSISPQVSESKPEDNTNADTSPEPVVIPASTDFIKSTFYEVAKTKVNSLALLLELNEIKSRAGKPRKMYNSNDTVRIIKSIFAKAEHKSETVTNDEISFVMSHIEYDNIRHAGTLMGSRPIPTHSSSFISGCSSISAKLTNTSATTSSTTTANGANINISYGPVSVNVVNPVANTGTVNSTPSHDAISTSTNGIKNVDKLIIPISTQNELDAADREFFRGLKLSDTAAGKPIR